MGNMEEKKESKDPFTHSEDGGRYRMAGYAHGQYYWACNKCDKKVIIRWIPEEKNERK